MTKLESLCPQYEFMNTYSMDGNWFCDVFWLIILLPWSKACEGGAVVRLWCGSIMRQIVFFVIITYVETIRFYLQIIFKLSTSRVWKDWETIRVEDNVLHTFILRSNQTKRQHYSFGIIDLSSYLIITRWIGNSSNSYRISILINIIRCTYSHL